MGPRYRRGRGRAARAAPCPAGRRRWCAACRFGTIRQPIIVVCVFAMRRSSRHLEGHLHLDRYIRLDRYIHLDRYTRLNRYIRLDRCIRYIRLDRYIRLESGVSAGRVCRGGDPPPAVPLAPAPGFCPHGPREPGVGPADGARPLCRGLGEWSSAPRRRRGWRRAPRAPAVPMNSRFTAAPIVPYNSIYSA